MKEEKQKTLTLTLPFVDFMCTDLDYTSLNSYEKDGTFFVRSNLGTYEIVNVCKKENNIWFNPLPPIAYNDFFMQDIEQEQADKFEEMNERIDRMHSELIAALLDKSEAIKGSFKTVKELMQMNYDRLGQLSLDIEDLSTAKQPDNYKPKGGYVDQETLLQIIKEVKK